MRFKVPQYIEHEAKIFGPLTFRQFVVVGFAGLIVLVLFFAIGDNFFLWLIISGIIVGTSLSLVFIKVEGMSLIALIGKSIGFFTKPKIYVWKKKSFGGGFVTKKKEIIDESSVRVKETPLRSTEGSKLKKLWSEIEIR
ncbi:MAG: PrgI family protein [Minisyncoccales bacterium]|jgi:hypothetical protein